MTSVVRVIMCQWGVRGRERGAGWSVCLHDRGGLSPYSC